MEATGKGCIAGDQFPSAGNAGEPWGRGMTRHGRDAGPGHIQQCTGGDSCCGVLKAAQGYCSSNRACEHVPTLGCCASSGIKWVILCSLSVFVNN